MPRRKYVYYWQWYKCSTRRRRGWIQVLATFLALLGLLVAYLNAEFAPATRLLLWFIPACALLLLIILTGCRASYELYRDLNQRYQRTKKKLRHVREALKVQRASHMRAIAGFILQCTEEVHNSDDAAFLLLQITHFLRARCGYQASLEFEQIFAPITKEGFDDTENAAEIRNKVIQEAVEYLKRVRKRGGNSGSKTPSEAEPE